MEHSPFRISVAASLGIIACIAVNLWLFRIGVLWGILGLNISKHIAIAYLCQILGVDRSAVPTKELPPSSPSTPT